MRAGVKEMGLACPGTYSVVGKRSSAHAPSGREGTGGSGDRHHQEPKVRIQSSSRTHSAHDGSVRAARSVGIQFHQAGARTGRAQGHDAERLTIDGAPEREPDSARAEHAEKTHRTQDGATYIRSPPNTALTDA